MLYIPTNRRCLFDAILVPSQALSSEPISFIECAVTDARDTQDPLSKTRDIATLIHSTLKQQAGFRIVVFYSGSSSELQRNSRPANNDVYSSLKAAVIVCKEGCQLLGVKY